MLLHRPLDVFQQRMKKLSLLEVAKRSHKNICVFFFFLFNLIFFNFETSQRSLGKFALHACMYLLQIPLQKNHSVFGFPSSHGVTSSQRRQERTTRLLSKVLNPDCLSAWPGRHESVAAPDCQRLTNSLCKCNQRMWMQH